MDDKKIKVPLNLKAIIIIVSMAVILCTAALIISGLTFSHTNEEFFKDEARDLAYTAALSVDGDVLKEAVRSVMDIYNTIPEDELVSSDDWGSPEFDEYLTAYTSVMDTPAFKSIHDQLSKVQNGGIDVLSSIYTMVYDSSRSEPFAIYVVDASTGDDLCLPGVLDTFNVEDNIDVVYHPEKGIEPYVTKTDEYGWLVVSGAPVYDSDGKYAGIVAVDLSMDDIKAKETDFILFLTTILIAITAVISIVFLILIRKAVISPLNKLSEAALGYMSSPDKNNSFENLDIKRRDEIGYLSNAMKQMERDIAEYINNITEMAAEKERLGTELKVATNIQTDMLPMNFPKRRDLSLNAFVVPAKEVGGDFYDFFFPDKDHLALVVADVSGKGIPAALFMVIAKSVIRNITMVGGNPAEILTVVNRILCENNKSGYFVTVWLGILTPSTGELLYANAGHEYPVIRRKDCDFALIKGDHCPPLAIDYDMSFDCEMIQLERGDTLFLYTDGVPEAKAENGTRYGTDRMLETLNAHKDVEPEELLSALKADIDAFVGAADQFDDITMMGLNYKG